MIWDDLPGDKENSSWIHNDIFQQLYMNQREKVASNIQNTYFVITQRWF
jgi:hypothetical protein